MGNDKHQHFKLKICVSGAADTTHCGEGALEQAKELGREIVRQGGILVTGATGFIGLSLCKRASTEGWQV